MIEKKRNFIRNFLFIFLTFWGIFIGNTIDVYAGKISSSTVVDKSSSDAIIKSVTEYVNWLPTNGVGSLTFPNGKDCDVKLGTLTWTDVKKNYS